jgi:uncharacterized membrane protein
LDRLAEWLAYQAIKHWLLFVNVAVALFLLPTVLAPMLMSFGITGPAKAIYSLYSLTCHQLPERSFFIGPKLYYSLEEIRKAMGPDADNIFKRKAFVGNEELGYKIAICQRDVAIYFSILLAGIAFSLVRGKLEPLSFKAFLILCIPLAVDGLTQLFGLRESTPPGRVFSGSLFGVALVWLLYPRIELAFREAKEVMEEKWREKS